MMTMNHKTNKRQRGYWAVPRVPDTPFGVTPPERTGDEQNRDSNGFNDPAVKALGCDAATGDAKTPDAEIRDGRVAVFPSMDALIQDLDAGDDATEE